MRMRPIRWIVAVLTLLLSTASAGHAALVGHWTFDEGTGATAADTSGHGQNASFASGGPGWTPTGAASTDQRRVGSKTWKLWRSRKSWTAMRR